MSDIPATTSDASSHRATSAAANHGTRRPAVGAAIAFMAGIALFRAAPHLPELWLAIATVIGALSLLNRPRFLFRKSDRLASLALAVGLLFAGLAIAQLEHFRYPSSHISAFTTDAPRMAQLEMEIVQPPRVLSYAFSTWHALPPKQVTIGRITRVLTWAGWRRSSGDVLVQIAEPHPRLRLGQTIRALALLDRPAPALNPGQFDWEGYYREQRILASVSIGRAANIQVIAEPGFEPIGWMRERARQLLAMGFPATRSLDHALLRALVLGDNDPELSDVQEQFRRTGTSHHLSISGMHVAVLGLCVFGLARLLRVRPRRACVGAMVLVALYGIAALPSAPVVRSVLLCLAGAVGLLSLQHRDARNLLGITVLLMLAYHPMDLFNAGFQLSFGTVLGLILFCSPIIEWWRARPANIDQQILLRLKKLTPSQHRKMRAKEWAFGVLMTGVVAWVVSAPLIATNFEQLNPWSILASLALAPFVFAALVGGFCKLVLTLALPGFAGAWASGAGALIAAMRWSVEKLAMLPGSDVPMPAPPRAMVIAFYVFLAIPLLPWRRAKSRRAALITALVGCLALGATQISERLFRGASAITSTTSSTSPSRSLRVTLLAIGAGQACVVEPPDGPAVLLDCGSLSLQDLVRKCIGPFLRHDGRRSIDRIVLSHGDYDHIGAAGQVVTAYDVREVDFSPHFRRHAIGNGPAEALLEQLDARDAPPTTIARGDHIDLDKKTSLEVLWPPPDCTMNSNNCGLVLKLTFAGRSILLPADIQVPAERELLAHQRDSLHADVLVAPHHGSDEETTAEFIGAVGPSVVLSSNDRTLSGKQHAFDAEMAAEGRALYRTNEWGSITIVIGENGAVHIEPYLSPERKQKAAR